jgi:hypothetical protein
MERIEYGDDDRKIWDRDDTHPGFTTNLGELVLGLEAPESYAAEEPWQGHAREPEYPIEINPSGTFKHAEYDFERDMRETRSRWKREIKEEIESWVLKNK